MSANRSLRSSNLAVRPNYNLGDMSKGRNTAKSRETTPYPTQKPTKIQLEKTEKEATPLTKTATPEAPGQQQQPSKTPHNSGKTRQEDT